MISSTLGIIVSLFIFTYRVCRADTDKKWGKGPIKALDADTFRLSIDGAVDKRMEYTLPDFKRAFPSRVEVVAALQVHCLVYSSSNW